jgi:hypothetical protein
MIMIKYAILFGWSLVLLAMVIFIIRSHPFIRRKKQADLNVSEVIYVVALLVAATLVLIPLLQTLAVDFDIIEKFYPDKFVATLVSSGSLVSLAGMGLFMLLVVAAGGLSTLFFFARKPLIEFDANNVTYSLLRAGLLLCLSLLLSSLCSPLFQYFLPAITTPFYR